MSVVQSTFLHGLSGNDPAYDRWKAKADARVKQRAAAQDQQRSAIADLREELREELHAQLKVQRENAAAQVNALRQEFENWKDEIRLGIAEFVVDELNVRDAEIEKLKLKVAEAERELKTAQLALRTEFEQRHAAQAEAINQRLTKEIDAAVCNVEKLIKQQVAEAGAAAAERSLQVQLVLRSEFEQRHAMQSEMAGQRLVKDIDAAVGNMEKLLRDKVAELETKLADRIVQGKQGLKGDVGEQGPPGTLPPVKGYMPGTVHYQTDVVTWEGATWQALRDTAREPSMGSEDWACLAAPGRDARSPTVRGTFDPEIRYRALDIVVLDGASFVARVDSPGQCPGDGWQLMAKQGRAGAKGERGFVGPRGEPGLSLREWKIDQERYAAIPVLSDGREAPALELRQLFEQYFNETSRNA